jgi:hypothetical protein
MSACMRIARSSVGTRIDAHLYDPDEGYRYTDYSVTVWKPKEMKKPEDDDLGFGVLFSGGGGFFPRRRDEDRKPTLRIDLPSIKVHHVSGVRFRDGDALPVERMLKVRGSAITMRALARI